MKTPADILKEAQKAENKDTLAVHKETILTLREKNYSWREIAKFLSDRGVETDHSRIFRFIHKTGSMTMENRGFDVPPAEKYIQALIEIKITALQRSMLKSHYYAHNRTVTYADLAEAEGYDSGGVANSQYGNLGYVLGNHLGMTFVPLNEDDPTSKPFYSSAIGTAKKYKKTVWMLIMHHELAKALDTLGADWFEK